MKIVILKLQTMREPWLINYCSQKKNNSDGHTSALFWKRWMWQDTMVEMEGMTNQCIKDYLFWVTRRSQKIRISHCSVQISRDDWFLYLENKIIIGHQIMYRVTFSTCLKYKSKICQRPTKILRRIDIINIITNFHKLMSKFDALSPLTNDTFLCNMCV